MGEGRGCRVNYGAQGNGLSATAQLGRGGADGLQHITHRILHISCHMLRIARGVAAGRRLAEGIRGGSLDDPPPMGAWESDRYTRA